MGAEADQIPAATTEEVPPTPDGSTEPPKSAESAPAVKDTDERPPKGVGKRIDELTRNWRTTERDRDYWRELALKAHSVTPETPKVESKPAKTIADFGYDPEQFAKHIAERVSEEASAKAVEQFRQEQEAQLAAERRMDFQERAEEYAKKAEIEDVERMFAHPNEGGPVVTEAMGEAIMDCENGPEILWHLANNPVLARKISSLPPYQQAREIGRLEARLADKPTAPQVSKAPAPAPKIAATEPAVEKDVKDMSDSEYRKMRERQIARRRGWQAV